MTSEFKKTGKGHMSPRRPLSGLLSWNPLSSHNNLFDDGTPKDFIYGCPIFKWLWNMTVFHDSRPSMALVSSTFGARHALFKLGRWKVMTAKSTGKDVPKFAVNVFPWSCQTWTGSRSKIAIKLGMSPWLHSWDYYLRVLFSSQLNWSSHSLARPLPPSVRPSVRPSASHSFARSVLTLSVRTPNKYSKSTIGNTALKRTNQDHED